MMTSGATPRVSQLAPDFLAAPSGLAVPRRSVPSMLDNGGAYMVFSDYAGDVASIFGQPDFEQWLPGLAADMPFVDMISALTALNHYAHHPDQAVPAVEMLRSALAPAARVRFDNLLRERQVFARQPVLRAMREVLADPGRAIQSRFLPGVAPNAARARSWGLDRAGGSPRPGQDRRMGKRRGHRPGRELDVPRRRRQVGASPADGHPLASPRRSGLGPPRRTNRC